MKDIPVSSAKKIARDYGYDQIIILGRKVGEDPEPHGEHLTTYGVTKVDCNIAERCGTYLKREILNWLDKTNEVCPHGTSWRKQCDQCVICPTCSDQFSAIPNSTKDYLRYKDNKYRILTRKLLDLLDKHGKTHGDFNKLDVLGEIEHLIQTSHDQGIKLESLE